MIFTPYSSIEEAHASPIPKGCSWSLSFGRNERYLGYVFRPDERGYVIVTTRGALHFKAEEVISLHPVATREATKEEKLLWPSTPYL